MTPIRRQYLAIKNQYPDTIVFFRLGDFYETFDDDAKIVSAELEIVLTSREMGKGQRVPLAGIPYHSVEGHLSKLVTRGYKVAIVEQVSDPATSKGIVEREVVRVVTPGTIVEPGILDSRSNNYLACFTLGDGKAGVAFVDITTGEFFTTQISGSDINQLLAQEIERLRPAECLYPKQDPRKAASTASDLPLDIPAHLTPYEAWHFDLDHCRQTLQEHFGVVSLEGFGCAKMPLAIRAAGAILQYIEETQKSALGQLTRLITYSTESFMALDGATRQNLELTQTSRTGTTKGSLVWVLDHTKTAMGGRLLRNWINQPLLDINRLRARQEAVQGFVSDTGMRAKTVLLLEKLSDLERIITRVSQGIANPHDLVSLKNSLGIVPEIGDALASRPASRFEQQERGAALAEPLNRQNLEFGEDEVLAVQLETLDRNEPCADRIDWLMRQLDPCEEVVKLIAQALAPDPARSVSDGGVIAAGFSDELDSLRTASRDARQWVARLEMAERERTGIKSLKVAYNRVFGYYIEVSNSNLEQAFSDGLRRQWLANNEGADCSCKTVREHLERCLGYIRKQTLVGAERFITPALKEQEAFILGAQERIVDLETTIFKQICEQVGAARQRVLSTARTLAHIDAFASLAEVAVRNNYVCPELTENGEIKIIGGRHPVVELTLKDEQFVPNDVYLSGDSLIVIITGPNMAGKSTYGLMAGLIVLLAQIGSFVPAHSATIGLVDRIFTRIGAQHDISAGQSTFLVEMSEAANILNNATPRSLVILDEIGRGTSTYDGMAIAQAIVEHIHNHPKLGCKTLFATHYHELTELETILPRVKNYRVDVLEEGGQVVFLHKVVRGGADRSYGVHVAKLAGIPKSVIRRAEEVLKLLEAGPTKRAETPRKDSGAATLQIAMFSEPDPVLEELKSLDVISMTPLEAITKLFELQKKTRERNA